MRRRHRIISLAFVVMLILCITITQIPGISNANALEQTEKTQAETTQTVGEIIKRSIRVFSLPKTSSEILGLAEEGTTYIVNPYYSSRRWYQIIYNDKTGYVRKAFVSLSETSSDDVSPSEITTDDVSLSETTTDDISLSETSSDDVSPSETTTSLVSFSGTTTGDDVNTPLSTTLETPEATPGPIATDIPQATFSPSVTKTSEDTSSPDDTTGDNSSASDSDSNEGTDNDMADSTEIIDANSWYTIDNAQFGIDNTGQNARATTDGINQALEWAKEQGYENIKFTDGTYLIQCTWNNRFIAPTDGILVPSGLTLDLGNAVFQMEANDYPAYCIFGIVNQSDVTIKGGTLIGDLDEHVYSASSDSSSHEWGFGICVSASTNVLIQGVTIKKMTGDGIILEGSYDYIANGGKVSSNVKVLNCNISNCRRQGISVVGSNNTEIAGNEIYNISGTDPQYGIDVEPELDYTVTNSIIHDNTIYGCSGGAIDACKGSDYEIYNNTCTGNIILAVFSSNVKIYENTIIDTFIRVMDGTTNVIMTDNILIGNSWEFYG